MSSESTQRKQTRVQKELDKAKKIAKDDARSVGSFAGEAVKSGGYLYPIYGVLYLLRNPRLLNGVRPAIYKSAMWSAIATVALFVLTYLPQVAVLAVVSGPFSFIAAIPLVLAESFLVSSFLVRTMIMPGASEKLFDAVLVQKGHSDLVEQGRTLNKTGGQITLGKSVLKPISKRFSTEGLWRYLITLPLNFIPGVGTAFFLYYNGSRAGPSYHSRFFELKKFDKSNRHSFVEQRRGAYTSFGAMSIALGLIPVVGTATQFSSTVGAALLASDFENKQHKSGQEAGGRDSAQASMGRNDDL
ncbi:hypothetical protein OIO90_001707 [Microbotryomycetes sp. JL221]|nr:hypothetical protein OIO90_001707 [Microbotryomycetes sp. JL221]